MNYYIGGFKFVLAMVAALLFALGCEDRYASDSGDNDGGNDGGGGNAVTYYCPSACAEQTGANRPSGCFATQATCQQNSNVGGGCPTSATSLRLNEWSDGFIPEFGTREEWFRFTATSSMQYIHFNSGASLNEINIRLYDSDCNEVDYPYYFYGNDYAYYDVTNGQTYHILVRPDTDSSGGTYQIAFNTSSTRPSTSGGNTVNYFCPTACATQTGASRPSGCFPTQQACQTSGSGMGCPTTATRLTENRWTDGFIAEFGARENWFRFTATAGTQYIHFNPGALLYDVNIRIFDNSCNEIGSSSNLYVWGDLYTSRTTTSGQTYHILVRPYYADSSGTYQIAFNTSTTPPSGGSVPTPTYVSATALSSSSIMITWDYVWSANTYLVYRGTSSSGTYTQIGETTSTSFTDTELSENTTYYYRVAASNNAGTSNQSSVVSATTPPMPDLPNMPTNVSASAQSSSSIRITWSAVEGANGYYVYRGTSSSGTFTLVGTITSPSTTSWTNTGLTAGTTYWYRVAAYNSAGTGTQSSVVSATTESSTLAAPTGVIATAQSSSSITVSWNAISGATGYYVYRSSSSSGIFTLVGTITSSSTTSWTNTGLTAGTTYWYRVAAYNSAGTGTQSSAASATTQSSGGGNITAASIAGTWSDGLYTITFNANGTGTYSYDMFYSESFTFIVSGNNTVTITSWGETLTFATDGNSFIDGWGSIFTRTSSGGGDLQIFSENFDGSTHGFTLVNGSQTNQWRVGSATSFSGMRSAYISNNNGTSNAYTVTSSSTVHMYRDITFPASSTPYTLTFRWRAQGESGYDDLRVFLTPTTTTPTAGSQQLSSNQIGNTYVGGGSTTWNLATITIPAFSTSTTRRLVFSWRNDNSFGTQPPAAIDDILITR